VGATTKMAKAAGTRHQIELRHEQRMESQAPSLCPAPPSKIEAHIEHRRRDSHPRIWIEVAAPSSREAMNEGIIQDIDAERGQVVDVQRLIEAVRGSRGAQVLYELRW